MLALKPLDTIGILGGGQLARMLAISAAQLGLKCHIFCPEEDAPAFEVSAKRTIADYEDEAALTAFAQTVDVVTYEFENVPLNTAKIIEKQAALRPTARALEVSQDRAIEKVFLKSCAIPIAPYAEIKNKDDLIAALKTMDGEGVLKARRLGYDGKGQVMLRTTNPITPQDALERIGNVPAVLEGFIPFTREVSVIAARAASGEVEIYDIADNVHENHILKTSTVPSNLSAKLEQDAKDIAKKILTDLKYIGVIGVEFFVVGEETNPHLLVNEIAPRVHNTGHWTMDACQVSQFQQHIRAIAGWPLGNPARHSDAIMTNLIGDDIHTWEASLKAEKQTSLHLYGKSETRKGRKMGHIIQISPKSGI